MFGTGKESKRKVIKNYYYMKYESVNLLKN